MHPDVQQRLYDEIAAVMDLANCVEYDVLTKLEYLDMFVCEVLRMYSSGVTVRLTIIQILLHSTKNFYQNSRHADVKPYTSCRAQIL